MLVVSFGRTPKNKKAGTHGTHGAESWSGGYITVCGVFHGPSEKATLHDPDAVQVTCDSCLFSMKAIA